MTNQDFIMSMIKWITYLSGPCGVWKSLLAKRMSELTWSTALDSSELYRRYAMEVLNANFDSSESIREKSWKMALPHYLEKGKSIFLTGHGFLNDDEIGFLDRYILILADNEIIMDRRHKDIDRQLSSNPRILSLTKVELNDIINEYHIRSQHFLARRKIPFTVIHNNEEIEQACENILSFLSKNP